MEIFARGVQKNIIKHFSAFNLIRRGCNYKKAASADKKLKAAECNEFCRYLLDYPAS